MTLTWSFIKLGPRGRDITVSLSSTGVLKKNEWPQLPLSNSWTDELRILRLFPSHQFSSMTVWAGLFNCAKNIRRLTGPCHVPTQWGFTSQPADISDDGGKEKMDWHVSWEQAKEIRDTGPVVMYLLVCLIKSWTSWCVSHARLKWQAPVSAPYFGGNDTCIVKNKWQLTFVHKDSATVYTGRKQSFAQSKLSHLMGKPRTLMTEAMRKLGGHKFSANKKDCS